MLSIETAIGENLVFSEPIEPQQTRPSTTDNSLRATRQLENLPGGMPNHEKLRGAD